MDKYKSFSVDDFLQDEFFNKWIKGSLQEEAALWEGWLAAHPEKLGEVQEAKSIILAFKDEPRELPEDFYAKLKARIDVTVSNQLTKKPGIKVLSWLKVAAVLATLIMGGWLLFKKPSPDQFITYKSKYAETKIVALPDGSQVSLNANSSIKWKNGNSGDAREVWLNGEAFFSVNHRENNLKRPVKFIAHTGDVDVEVLGTEFNINNGGGETEVLLTKGSVRLSVVNDNKSPLIMEPNDYVSYDSKTRAININKVSPENYIAWRDHKYIFEKRRLEDIGEGLHRYYGKAIVFEDVKMQNQRLSGTLELQDESTVIKTLSTLLGVQVTGMDNKIIIGSK